LRQLASEGVSILYISHKLDEIRELCDVATMLRNGRSAARAIPREESNASLARLMVGGELEECRTDAA
jgi:general nucleoside transport system ATP-binding protein